MDCLQHIAAHHTRLASAYERRDVVRIANKTREKNSPTGSVATPAE